MRPPPSGRAFPLPGYPRPLVLLVSAALALVLCTTAVAVARSVRSAPTVPPSSVAPGPVGAPVPSPAASSPTASPAAAASPSPRPARSATPAASSATVRERSRSAAPRTPSPGPSRPTPRSPAPTQVPRAAEPTPDRSLTGNDVYRVDLGAASLRCPAGVREPRPALPDGRLARYARSVLECLHTAFAAPLAAQGFELTKATVRVYRGSVRTPCGTYPQDGAPAYYCSATRTIYWPESSDEGEEAFTYARLGYVALLAHEFGHHVQADTGLLGGYADRIEDAGAKQRHAATRRLELQAQCFEGVFLHTVRDALEVDEGDLEELRAWHEWTGDEDPPEDRTPDHGSSGAQVRWLERGLDRGDLGRCNTWSAPASSVR